MTLNLLFSYAYWKGPKMRQVVRDLPRDIVSNVMTDSGAFTAFSRGDTVTLEGYFEWLDYLGETVDHFIGLDVIGDPDGTMRNHLSTLQAGRHPIPVLHPNCRNDEIEIYQKTGYVAVAGVGGRARHVSRSKIARLVSDISPECAVHFLGRTRHQTLAHFKPHSADSSTYTDAARGGWGVFFTGAKIVRFPYFRKQPPQSRMIRRRLSRLLEAHGYDSWAELSADEESFYSLGIRAHILYNEHIERTAGTKIYLSMVGATWVNRVLEAHMALYEKGLLREQ